VLTYTGPDAEGILRNIRLASPGSHALNPAFDVTPARYISGYITEIGILKADELIKNCQ
jgi:methylthioribose-1-phosphate isomerase